LSIFKQENPIEISSDDHEFRGSSFSDTVVHRDKENPSMYVVQYYKLFGKELGKIPLQETLHWVQLRHAPPPTGETNKSVKFKFNNEVKAFLKIWLLRRRHQ
ncbi:hypothetical protein LINPERPRIM_LOCUS35683, partial [Linum perenne]